MSADDTQITKAGFTAIIGEPNAGKSTLMNTLLKTKLSIVSSKPQTTRKYVSGIHTEGNTQIVFFDTPGLLEPKYELHKSMMSYVDTALEGADAVLVVMDGALRLENNVRLFDSRIAPILRQTGKPAIAVINKIDSVFDKKAILPLLAHLHQSGLIGDIIPISALKGENTESILPALDKLMPEHEFYYDPEMLSEQPERFFVSEIIRETIFTLFRKEIPYSTDVQIVEFVEREDGKWQITADIVVERDSQKAIIIGKQGSQLKELGTKSRMTIERHLDQKIYLSLFVKVKDDWRDDASTLKFFGY